MSHLDPDLVALVALGEDVVDRDQRAHIDGCAHCAAELAAFRRAVDAGRSGGETRTLLTPPPRVWDAIESELGLGPAAAAPAAPAATPAAPASASERPRPTDAVARGRRSRRRPLVFTLVGVAAAAVIVAGVFGSGILSPRPAILSEASLAPFPGWDDAEGEALLEEVDGHTRVVVHLDAAVPDDGYREVWLLKADASDLVSLGILEGRDGSFALPDGVDPAEFPVVDISQEEHDGDPGHSGHSIVRGELSPA